MAGQLLAAGGELTIVPRALTNQFLPAMNSLFRPEMLIPVFREWSKVGGHLPHPPPQ